MSALPRPALRIVRHEDDARDAPLGRQIRRALVCLDRSAASDVCLAYASIVAEAFAAELTLTHVLPVQQPSSDDWTRTDVLEWDLARREADQYLVRAKAVLSGRVRGDVHTIVSQGAPGDRIAAIARETSSDLTIVGGRCVAGGIGLGSTAQRLLASVPGSVLVAYGAASLPPRRILVPLDGSSRTESVLPLVIGLASTYGAEVTLVHVVCERPQSAVLAHPADLQLAQQLTERLRHNAEDYLDRVRERELHALPAVRCVARTCADDRRALLAIATEVEADLLVLAAHGSTCEGDDPFGSVAAHVLTHSRIPVLVLQDLAAPAPALEPALLARRPSGIRRREEA